MIFSLQFTLIFAGYGAISNLSGQYMTLYTGATQVQLGLYFMIPPLLVLVRPFICASADRNQSHKQLYTCCLFGSTVSYLPYCILPYFLENGAVAMWMTKPIRFWLLMFLHLVGSFFFNGVRTLADALAVNHAKRTDQEYVSLRKYGPIGFGLCGYIFGQINEDWLMPNFVPAMSLFCVCMFLLGLLVHLWPEEYFVMSSESHQEYEVVALPSYRETLAMILTKTQRVFHSRQEPKLTENRLANPAESSRNRLSSMQQVQIFALIIKRDFRIPLALLVLLWGGWICRSAQNFVFINMERTCQAAAGNCNASSLAGAMIAGMSIFEFLTYLGLEALKDRRITRIPLIELAILSLAFHYFSLAFLADQVSPYFFLIESLHGFEFAIFISTCLNWGYMFASEVEFLIPELQMRGIIGYRDDLNLVKVSLVATMMGCMTLAYDGIGSLSGSVFYGFISERHSFSCAWIINGCLAAIELMFIMTGVTLGKCFNLNPRISTLKTDATLKVLRAG